MQARKAKKVVREIEAAAVALGFPRWVSYSQVERELGRYCPRRPGKAELNSEADRPRFLAVAGLCLLMDAAGNRTAALRREISELMKRTRELVAKAAA
jgi:hypothetical protein